MNGVCAALRVALGVVMVLLFIVSATDAQGACPPACAGQTLNTPNFSHQNLADAHFENATIIGGVFYRAKLNGAHFDGATFQSAAGHPTQTPDFTYADLTNATFVGAKFLAPTYFTYATLTCADFSQTNINNGNAIFGDEPLVYTTNASCRTKFKGTTMSCEFINDWRAFDLTGAVVTACLSQLSGRNFSGAIMDNVILDNAVLDGAQFTKASLHRAHFNGATLQCLPAPGKCVDMTLAQMQGAQLNNANLTGASLYQALLSNAPPGIPESASLHSAHLRNVNLSSAQLSGTDFRSANFFGDFSAIGGCKTTGPSNAGFTVGCASANNANMDGTHFDDAYVGGVDFGNAAIGGVEFGNAVLVGASFAAATIGTSPTTGSKTDFTGAFMQGTNLKEASVSNVDLTDAFVDFQDGGNTLYVTLGGLHTSFACSPLSQAPCGVQGASVCVAVVYPQATTVPEAVATMTCPHHTSGPCGKAEPRTRRGNVNVQWQSRLVIGTAEQGGPPPGWYASQATYDDAAPDALVCSGKGSSAAVASW